MFGRIWMDWRVATPILRSLRGSSPGLILRLRRDRSRLSRNQALSDANAAWAQRLAFLMRGDFSAIAHRPSLASKVERTVWKLWSHSRTSVGRYFTSLPIFTKAGPVPNSRSFSKVETERPEMRATSDVLKSGSSSVIFSL